MKFIQLGTLIRQRNVKYFYLGPTKREILMPAEVPVTSVYNMEQSVSKTDIDQYKSEMYIAFDPWNESQNSNNQKNIIMVENIRFVNNSNSNQTVSKEFPVVLPIHKALATSASNTDSHLNRKNSATNVHSSENQQLDKSIENIAKESDVRSLHKVSRADNSAIHGKISHIYPGKSNSIKLLSLDKDSQLKFLEMDSPMTEREKLRRASSIKSAIKGNNFPTMESSRLATSTLGKTQERFIESSCKKRKRTRCAGSYSRIDLAMEITIPATRIVTAVELR